MGCCASALERIQSDALEEIGQVGRKESKLVPGRLWLVEAFGEKSLISFIAVKVLLVQS
jgi:hypothetical protein